MRQVRSLRKTIRSLYRRTPLHKHTNLPIGSCVPETLANSNLHTNQTTHRTSTPGNSGQHTSTQRFRAWTQARRLFHSMCSQFGMYGSWYRYHICPNSLRAEHPAVANINININNINNSLNGTLRNPKGESMACKFKSSYSTWIYKFWSGSCVPVLDYKNRFCIFRLRNKTANISWHNIFHPCF